MDIKDFSYYVHAYIFSHVYIVFHNKKKWKKTKWMVKESIPRRLAKYLSSKLLWLSQPFFTTQWH